MELALPLQRKPSTFSPDFVSLAWSGAQCPTRDKTGFELLCRVNSVLKPGDNQGRAEPDVIHAVSAVLTWETGTAGAISAINMTESVASETPPVYSGVPSLLI